MNLDFLLGPLFLSGVVFAVVGFIMYKFPPKEINSLYGYRTRKSMESQEKWDFSQRYSAVLMIKVGLIFCGISLLKIFIELSMETILIAEIFILLLGVGLLLYLTEKAIKDKFGK
ncbi:SdpI family protein [Mesonia maritima]|uniref:Membrane protein n=1 Tax=Mesonia maritima TaxID=1793873 RepID=A0ABU1K659_9FLAO|nr:SdpI family protein [Mesonia maritima]MDR6301096.1 putative membrane protein [Mesonia maritima]